MSRETALTLNTMTLIGFAAKRGKAWHYRAELQGAESNHYDGAVPVADVRRRLLNWEAVSRDLFVQVPGHVPTMVIDGVEMADPFGVPELVKVEGKQAIVHSGNGAVMGIFSDGYEIHQFEEWLVERVESILDDGLAVGSAGLLKGGAQCWVSVEVPENITTPEGVEFRPNLLACTSHDGSLATTYKRVVTNVVCDNTMAAGLGEVGQQLKIKHSKNSRFRMAEARDALNIIYTIADDFQAEVKALCETTVTNRQWSQFLDAHSPMVTDKGERKSGRALTMAENERATLTRLWNSDLRVSPWRNTAWGVMQAVNTYTHHEGIVRNASRAERNMSNAVTGKIDGLDAGTIGTLSKVLISA